MTRTRWTLFAILCACLPACPGGDDKSPFEPGDTSTSTGTGAVTVTTMGSVTATGDAPTGGTTATDSTSTAATATTEAVDSSTGDTSTSTTAPDPSSTGGSTIGDASATTLGDTSGDTGPGLMPCGGKIWACGDGIDNDGDGKIDNADFECISPCDDDEASFQTNLPGMAEDCKNDCYWDADSGAGQDKCQYDLQCDAQDPGGQIGCGFTKECPAQTPAQCIDVCVPLIPNGCDCFGCCHVDTPNGVQDYYLDSSGACALDNLAACNHCTFQEQCANPCEGCEVCFGQQAPPQGCDPGDGDQCEAGVKTCTMGGDECGEFEFCQTGCCQAIVPG